MAQAFSRGKRQDSNFQDAQSLTLSPCSGIRRKATALSLCQRREEILLFPCYMLARLFPQLNSCEMLKAIRFSRCEQKRKVFFFSLEETNVKAIWLRAQLSTWNPTLSIESLLPGL